MLIIISTTDVYRLRFFIPMVYSNGKVNVASYSFVVATKAAKIKKFAVVLNKRFVFAFWTIRQFNVSQAQRRFYACHNVTVSFQSTPGVTGRQVLGVVYSFPDVIPT